MPSRSRPTIITDARHGTTLSVDARERRYLWTMVFRVAAFVGAFWSPLPWNIVLIAAAVFLPAIAVLLGNARDNSLPAGPDAAEPPRPPALERVAVVRGEVAPDGGLR